LIIQKDCRPEPKWLIAKAFFGGCVSIIVAMLLGTITNYIFQNIPEEFLTFLDSYITAGLAEEFSKWIIFYFLIAKSKDFDSNYDGILYAVVISLGFALVENFFYVYDGGITVAIFRGALAVPGHALYGVAMGYFFSLYRFSITKNKRKLLAKSILIPALLHGTYDFIIFTANNNLHKGLNFQVFFLLLFSIFIIFLWKQGLNKIKSHLETSPKAK